ncbi:TetR/AcrR family transcriptional regulator [Kribbella sp. VKM Ac-2566]|uniref:TetR/AcrR family transcriptional regulator n=1 Tax=Kribbella sp. VKM Ac-2566 TaxID=2512218 RepID=UPI0010627541|nr:helix-turn-helix domain-containing protein [Kribbella sp. VKM Ac-2566]TDW98559.1 TetR family transcriptional regulator [Kribbella sp. VKM Ac-2566]
MRADAVRNLEKILSTAARVLAADPGASMVKIAAETGVDRRTVYRQFESREALLAAIYAARYDAVDIVFESARLTEAPVAVALHRYVEGIIDATRQWPVAFDQMVADPTTAARRELLGKRLDAFIGRAVDEGLFRADLPAGWIEALLRQVIRVAAEDVPHIKAAQAADLAVDALLHGVGQA